MDVFSY